MRRFATICTLFLAVFCVPSASTSLKLTLTLTSEPYRIGPGPTLNTPWLALVHLRKEDSDVRCTISASPADIPIWAVVTHDAAGYQVTVSYRPGEGFAIDIHHSASYG